MAHKIAVLNYEILHLNEMDAIEVKLRCPHIDQSTSFCTGPALDDAFRH